MKKLIDDAARLVKKFAEEARKYAENKSLFDTKICLAKADAVLDVIYEIDPVEYNLVYEQNRESFTFVSEYIEKEDSPQ